MTRFRVALDSLAELLGEDNLLADSAARLVYSRDASHITQGRPLAVALPPDADTAREVVRRCAAGELPIVTRGSGTGLSGGAVPADGEIVLATARLNHLDPVDVVGRRVRVGVGVLNDQVSAHAAAHGLHFAPDPSSQSASTIGGNIAENAGGPHCLRYGVTLQHLLRLEWCDARGRAWVTGRGLACERGIDLLTLLCGSEGTLGVVTAADLKLVPSSAAHATLAAFFPDLDEAVSAVGTILGAGLLPVAIEMIDQAMLEAVEAAFGFGFPTDVAAAMILEFAGGEQECAEDARSARDRLLRGGAREVRLAEDEATRLELWKCRKKAFGAVGRLAPSYVTMDVVVPLGHLPELVREIQVIKARHGVEISTAFHAGDGNLHPGVHYDDRDPESSRAAHAAADEIMRAALARSGSVSGEHGIGLEKLHAAPWQLDATALDLMWSIKRAFDPRDSLNPGKALPPERVECAAPSAAPEGIRLDLASMTVTAAADVTLAELQEQIAALGLWLPVGLADPDSGGPGLGGDRTVGSLIDHQLLAPSLLAGRTVRDLLLELWAETGDGRRFHAGAPVLKNVVGYSLPGLFCGAGGTLATPLAATFPLQPAPELIGLWQLVADGTDRPGPEGLVPVLQLLAGRDPVLGGSLAVLDPGPPLTLTVVAPIRNRAWDQREFLQHLESAAGRAGLVQRNHLVADWAAGRTLLKHLPQWSRSSADWTVAAGQSGAGAVASWLPANLPARWIWQAQPRLLWTPDEFPIQEDWHADLCCRSGRAAPLPEPGPDVPHDLLRTVKRIFDPEHGLPTPEWLREASDG